MEEFGRDAFTATMYIKRCGRQLLEKCWVCERATQRSRSICTVAVKKLGTIMGHLPWRLSRVCLFFLWWGGTISCTVIDWEEKILR